MGYLFLLLAVIFNLTKSYCSKKVSNKVETLSDTVNMTVARNAFCAVIGAVLIVIGNNCNFYLSPKGFVICLVAGLAVGLNYIVWVMSLKSGVYLMASASNSASFIVAAVGGLLFFSETLTLFKGLSILLILLAIFFMGRYQKESYGKPNTKYILLLATVFLTAGVSSITQKWFAKTHPDASAHTYTFYSLLISFVILLILSFFIKEQKTVKMRIQNIKRLLPAITLMAVCFYGTTYFQSRASRLLETVVMYPLLNGLLLAAGSLMAWICFKESPNKNSIIGVILVFSAIMLSRL